MSFGALGHDIRRRMEFEEAARFMQTFHRGVVTTTKKNGAGQMSILSSGPYKGGAAFVARGSTAKIANLKRNPRCTVLTLNPNWSSYVVVEGDVEIHGWDNTDHEELRSCCGSASKLVAATTPTTMSTTA